MALFRKNTFARSTKKTYVHYLLSYIKFCQELHIPFVPISASNLARYIAFLSSRLTFGSIQNYLSVVRLVHLEADLRNPMLSHYVCSVLKGARRTLGDMRTPKLPITPPILRKILGQLDLTKPKDITFWAACLVAFFSFFRKSNLFVQSRAEYTPGTHLGREHVQFHRGGVNLTVNRTKTIQFRERCLTIPLPRIQGSCLCPAQALLLSFKVSSSPVPKCPLLMYLAHRGLIPLSYPGFLSQLKECLHGAGLQPNLYSGHSFRRGGATFALECGLPADLIKSQGDWRSNAYQAYLDPSPTMRQKVASTLGEHIVRDS